VSPAPPVLSPSSRLLSGKYLGWLADDQVFVSCVRVDKKQTGVSAEAAKVSLGVGFLSQRFPVVYHLGVPLRFFWSTSDRGGGHHLHPSFVMRHPSRDIRYPSPSSPRNNVFLPIMVVILLRFFRPPRLHHPPTKSSDLFSSSP